MRAVWCVLFLAVGIGSNSATAVADDSATTADQSAVDVAMGIADQLVEVIQTGINRRSVVGAQLAVRTSDELVVTRQFSEVIP